MYRFLAAILMGATSLSIAYRQFLDLSAFQSGRHEPEPAIVAALCSEEESPPHPPGVESVQAVLFPDASALLADAVHRAITEYCHAVCDPTSSAIE